MSRLRSLATTFFGLLLLSITATTAPAQTATTDVKGDNVQFVRYAEFGRGTFMNIGGKNWKESNSQSNSNFVETGRDEWSVYLNDGSRQLGIQLDLWRKKVVMVQANGTRTDLYDIVESSAAAPAVSTPPITPTTTTPPVAPATGDWAEPTSSARLKHVSVGSDGELWGVSSDDQVWRWSGSNWGTPNQGARLKQISVGNASNIWGVNVNDQVFRYNGSDWTEPNAGARLKHVSVASDGTVWGVSSDDQVWRWDGSNWSTPNPGARLKQICTGSASQVWGVNSTDMVYRYDGSDWQEPNPGARLKYVTVASDGTVWGVNSADMVYRHNGTEWQEPNPGARLKQISVGSAALVWGVNAGDQVYRYGAGVAAGGDAPAPVTNLPGRTTSPPPSACPPGFTPGADGLCMKPAPEPRILFGTLNIFNSSSQLRECNARYPQGCDVVGFQVLVRCAEGSTAAGPMMCTRGCPPGWTDVGVGCKEPAGWTVPVARSSGLITDPVDTSDPDVRYLDVPFMQPGDLDAIMNWIQLETIGAKLPFCWRDTYSVPHGVPLSQCPPGTERGAADAVCYPACKPGYKGVGPVCWQACPPGFGEGEITCVKPQPYGRGEGWVGYSAVGGKTAIQRCEEGEGKPCEMNGLLAYPRCAANYHAVGCCICSPDCPPGFGDAGAFCNKDSYGRGAGVPMVCADGLEGSNEGLCYPHAKAGYTRVVNVYWQDCGPGWTNCGAGCQQNSAPVLGLDAPWRDCATTIVDQVSSVAILTANIASLGLATPGTAAAGTAGRTVVVGGKALTGATRAGKAMLNTAKAIQDFNPSTTAKMVRVVKRVYNSRTYQIMDDMQTTVSVASTVYDAEETVRTTFSEDFVEQTSPAIAARIDAEFSPAVRKYIKQSWGDAQLGRLAKTQAWEATETALSLVSLVDPSGVTGVVAAFTKPVCQPSNPFPSLKGYYK